MKDFQSFLYARLSEQIGENMKINPVYQKELKTSVRSMKTAIIILGYNGLLALFGLFAFYVTFEYESKYGGNVNYSDILQIYAILTATEFGLVLFVIPALTAASISGEREKQTLEILLTTKLSPLQIILGKLASSISMMILLAISSLPVLALVFSIGGVTLSDLIEFMILVIVTAIFVGSIGIFFSTLFKKTTAATVSTYGIILFLTMGSLLIVWAITIAMELKLNKLSTATNINISPDVGNWLLILLINPAITCFAMIESQTGTGSRLTTFFLNFGTISTNLQNNWFLFSVILQLGISILLIISSARLLDPLKERCHRKKTL